MHILSREGVFSLIKEYDKVRLITGELARIVEIFSDFDFLAEVANKDGDIEVRDINRDQIASVFEELEKPLATA